MAVFGAAGRRQRGRRRSRGRDYDGFVGGGRCGFRFGALGVHQPTQAGGDIPVGIVEARQVAVDGGGLGRPATLFQLGSESVQITQHGGIGFAALEFGEALFEIVEEPRGLGSHRSRHLLCGGRRRGCSEAAPEEQRASAGQ